jgi:hypothetical protein
MKQDNSMRILAFKCRAIKVNKTISICIKEFKSCIIGGSEHIYDYISHGRKIRKRESSTPTYNIVRHVKKIARRAGSKCHL